tara:strand:+ start:304 stop:780 length:477 start_codon:yes stop_codon:yes gene_type:complete
MKNQIHLTLQKSAVSLIVVIMTISGQNGFTDEYKKNLPPLNQNSNIFQKQLIPMPIGNRKSASSKVNPKRNPFQRPQKSEITNVEDLFLTLQLKGLAKSGNKSLAIIESEDIQKFYRIGDSLDNGYLIKSISFEDISVDISNGSKNYRLILNNLNKAL